MEDFLFFKFLPHDIRKRYFPYLLDPPTFLNFSTTRKEYYLLRPTYWTTFFQREYRYDLGKVPADHPKYPLYLWRAANATDATDATDGRKEKREKISEDFLLPLFYPLFPRPPFKIEDYLTFSYNEVTCNFGYARNNITVALIRKVGEIYLAIEISLSSGAMIPEIIENLQRVYTDFTTLDLIPEQTISTYMNRLRVLLKDLELGEEREIHDYLPISCFRGVGKSNITVEYLWYF